MLHYNLLDLPLLSEIVLEDDALKGSCDASRKMITDIPYNYMNTFFLYGWIYIWMYENLDLPSLNVIRGTSTLECIGSVELNGNML